MISKLRKHPVQTDTVFFFDMDGTLIDTNLANFLSYKKAVLSELQGNYALTFDPKRRFNRKTLTELVPGLTASAYDRIIQKKEQLYESLLGETRLNTSVASILFKYSSTHKTVLVTNCRQNRAIKTLSYHGLTNKFNRTFFGQINLNGEPINKFRYALSELGVLPQSVIAFENEELEIRDARQAGIRIINPEVASL